VTLGVKLVTQLTNRVLNAKRVEQWDRYLVPQNVFLVCNKFTIKYLDDTINMSQHYCVK